MTETTREKEGGHLIPQEEVPQQEGSKDVAEPVKDRTLFTKEQMAELLGKFEVTF